ncbi:hypothetical protein B1B04_20605 [Lysinibacillus sp. KCTC 33748]|uniref:hypothetical protein n=1 Tax=unclassified Lysinibacillus TaxID=2636778 RepID=UPI0009A76C58|nr:MULTISPECIES: hypothetical protein [unclassified Lysinibacillus]OXS68527.1 hypothetical protein B1B04_20605 [Lysinibacillus sp. KCTC 33748]SKC10517.1 hypothetical protein SAMN06295926_12354 [Lysinibacillus sp. AC-3]
MKLFLNVTTYLVTAIAAVLAFYSLAVIYYELSGSGSGFEMDLQYLLGILFMVPITVIISFIICYFLTKKITCKPILFGTIIGFWLIKVIEIVNDSYNSYHYQSDEDYIPNFFISNTIDFYILLLPTILVFLSHFLLKKYNNWLHISGFTLGATISFFTTYAIVLFMRHVNNSLTSYHYFDNKELMIVLVGTAIITILGNIIGLKKFNQAKEN